MATNIKVYEEVLNKIRNYIKEHQLSSGDRLPSERELSEQLNAGRSSIREALRAMELLGLIETRRGEGTFLRSYRPYHSVELLSEFILQEPNTRKDILVAKKILEKEATKMAFVRIKNQGLDRLNTVLANQVYDTKQTHYYYFTIIFEFAENALLEKIWKLMEGFSYTLKEVSYNNDFYYRLIEVLKRNEYEMIEDLFDNYYI